MPLKFEKKKESSLLGHTVVNYEYQYPEGENPTNKFRIQASRFGIALHGESPCLGSTQDLQEFADYVSQAWLEHKKLVPKLEVSKKLP